ncbi:MAG: peptidylprolyl isomerase [Acidobacteriota bacterium]
MKTVLISLMLSSAMWAQTAAPKAKAAAPPAAKAATPAAPKAAATAKGAKAAPAMDLLKPETVKGKPPAIFIVRLQTTKGNIDMRVMRAWAPNGVERFYNLVRAGYYDNNYFFRVLAFMAQVGISSRAEVNRIWSDRTLFDDRVIQSNVRGMVSFAAMSAPNTRSTQFFINKKDENTYLDGYKFAPFAQVVEGMEVVDQIYSAYGEPADAQDGIANQGESFVLRNYPRMDKIIKASILKVVEP